VRKIFLFESNSDITNLIRNAIQNEFDDEVKNIANFDEAIKEISMGDYDLIIARDKIQNQKDFALKFINAVEMIDSESRVISIGAIESDSNRLIGQLPDKFNMSDLINLIKSAFQSEKSSGEKTYTEVQMEVLELMNISDFDLYTRMRRPGKSDQYVKKVEAGTGMEIVSSLKEKGFKNLFLEKRHRLHFSKDLVTQVGRRINIDFNDFSQIIKTGESVYRLSRKLIFDKGTNEISYRLINCLAEEMVGNLKKSKNNISDYIFASLEHTTSYSYKHLNLIGIFCFISLPFLKLMEEKKDSYLDHFIYAAYFHDIILNKEGMAEIHSKKDWLDCEFNEDEKNMIRDHAKLASELLARFPGSSSESIQIVKEHHGVPSGVGFNARKVGTLEGASVLFDVIHDFVEMFLNFPPDGSLASMLKELEESYQLPVYKRYAAILKQGIVDTFKEED
jgi:hypothetical protein